jgi:hypothetical protein
MEKGPCPRATLKRDRGLKGIQGIVGPARLPISFTRPT